MHADWTAARDDGIYVNRELLFINFISTCLAFVMVYCTAFTFVITLLLNVC